jgi:hypothetical protein
MEQIEKVAHNVRAATHYVNSAVFLLAKVMTLATVDDFDAITGTIKGSLDTSDGSGSISISYYAKPMNVEFFLEVFRNGNEYGRELLNITEKSTTEEIIEEIKRAEREILR